MKAQSKSVIFFRPFSKARNPWRLHRGVRHCIWLLKVSKTGFLEASMDVFSFALILFEILYPKNFSLFGVYLELTADQGFANVSFNDVISLQNAEDILKDLTAAAHDFKPATDQEFADARFSCGVYPQKNEKFCKTFDNSSTLYSV
jgi:hypothetical protein